MNREDLIKLIKKYQNGRKIARHLGVSRQYVYILFKKYNIKGIKEIMGWKVKIVKCNYCGKEFKSYKKNQKRYWCSKECKEKDLFIFFPCQVCGKIIKKYKWDKRSKVVCSKKCWGHILGKKWGWGARKERRNK